MSSARKPSQAPCRCKGTSHESAGGSGPSVSSQSFSLAPARMGNQALQRWLRARAILPKGEVSRPDDPLEREAERAAERALSAAPSAKGRQRLAAAAPQLPLPQLGTGRPLDAASRAFFEPRFGHDFGSVRIHTDAAAAATARSFNALAYSADNHVVFARGQYAPATSTGRRLIAHELAHVVQRAEGRGGGVIARQVDSIWVPGEAHGHTPTGRWADVQADAAAACGAGILGLSDSSIECACAVMTPAEVLSAARATALSGSPLAQAHLDHYLTGGGVNLAEDLEDVLRRDSGVRRVLAKAAGRSPRGHVRIEQTDYAVMDFQLAFGAIDRMDYEVDAAAGTIHVWFQDRYEWHPYGYGYAALPGDAVRGTNCVHAAAVEMQSSGAADYWMFGNATVPLSLLAPAPVVPSGGPTL